ncbi:rhodopsin, GQ-coupled-like [Littorina saxatilis]|uniref:rhodopsin, GQ-coupled-like n=1 Tax=Littorina saxatilis TaxID=31220 RepID=UPI0038B43109
MIIAVERCLCVVFPLKAANLLHTRTMTSIIVVTVISLQLLCLIFPFKFDVVTTYDEVTEKTIVLLPHTSQYLDYKTLIDVLDNIIIMTVIPFVTFVVVTVATVVTVIKLKRVIAWRVEAARNVGKQSEVGLVKMLVIVSCIYIVTASPNIVLGTIRFIDSDFGLTGKYRNTYVMTHLLFLGLGSINSTVNVFVYVTRSSKFRIELYRMFPFCSRPKELTSRRSHFVPGRVNANSISAKVDRNESGLGSSEGKAAAAETD